jgi:type I restriction enzyme, S subunit
MTNKQLADAADIVRGIAFAKEDKRHEPGDGLIACLRTTNVQRSVEWDDLWFVPEQAAKRADQIVRSGDILISTANSYELVGKVAMVGTMPHRATLGAFISLIRPKPHVNASYLYHQLTTVDVQSAIRSCASTTTNISNVSTKKLATIPIKMPDRSAQLATVTYLDEQLSRLDASVAALHRVQANLKRYRASVLKSACEGLLVPSEAELAREEGRDFESGAQLLQRILAERRKAWLGKGQPDEPDAPTTPNLPELPEGWGWASAAQACDPVVDCHNKTAPYSSTGIPLVRTTNIRDGQLSLDGVRFVDEPTYAFWSRRCPPKPGDVLFTREAPMGEAAIIPAGLKLCLGQRTMLMRPSPAISSTYLLSALTSPVVQQLIQTSAVGSGVKHLRVGDVERLPIPPHPSPNNTASSPKPTAASR